MSKTILAQVDGFTPLIDSMVDEYGVIGAAIFGRIWRYCQGKQGECTAPMSQIGKELDLDKSTISRYVARLVSDEYLEDLKPDAGNTPHAYRDTGKAGLQITLTAKPKSVAQNNRALHRTTERCTEQQSVAQNNAHIRNIDTKRQEETIIAPDGATDEPAQQKMACAECGSEDVKACGPDVGRCGKCKGNKLGFVGLKAAPAKPSEKSATSDSEQTLALADWFTYNGDTGCLSSARKLRKIYGDDAIQSTLAQVKGKRVKNPYGYFCKVADGMNAGETSEAEPSTYEAILAKCRRENSTQPDSIISYMAGQEFQRLQAAL